MDKQHQSLETLKRVSDHFGEATKMVPLGSGSQRELGDIRLPLQRAAV